MERANTSKLMQSVDISISTVRTKSVKTSASYYEACANAKMNIIPLVPCMSCYMIVIYLTSRNDW